MDSWAAAAGTRALRAEKCTLHHLVDLQKACVTTARHASLAQASASARSSRTRSAHFWRPLNPKDSIHACAACCFCWILRVQCPPFCMWLALPSQMDPPLTQHPPRRTGQQRGHFFEHHQRRRRAVHVGPLPGHPGEPAWLLRPLQHPRWSASAWHLASCQGKSAGGVRNLRKESGTALGTALAGCLLCSRPLLQDAMMVQNLIYERR